LGVSEEDVGVRDLRLCVRNVRSLL
jgi:hypothetical protein